VIHPSGRHVKVKDGQFRFFVPLPFTDPRVSVHRSARLYASDSKMDRFKVVSTEVGEVALQAGTNKMAQLWIRAIIVSQVRGPEN